MLDFNQSLNVLSETPQTRAASAGRYAKRRSWLVFRMIQLEFLAI